MKNSISSSRVSLDDYITRPEVVGFGPINLQEDIKTTIGPFQYLSAYKIDYPEAITAALVDIYAEYNHAFSPLMESNKEWSTDYQYCMNRSNGAPVNYFVQIDMVGLTNDYLQAVTYLDNKSIRENLREFIFEIENSIAIYQILSGIFAKDGQVSFFGERFRESLDELKKQHNMPIALVALTEQKFQAMREIEFGKKPSESLTDEEVLNLSGFDTFFGPEELISHFNQNGGKSDYLLYVRASDPLSKLRDPDLIVDYPLLADSNLRRIIKAHTITMNIDNPEWSLESAARINDTKAYLPSMNMAYPIHSAEDLRGSDLKNFLESHKLNRSTDADKIIVRAKPMKASYGCYGHERGPLESSEFRRRMKKNLNNRGPYIIQPEKPTPVIINENDGNEYTYIDRNFFFTNGHTFKFLGGFRLLMSTSSTEAVRGKIHNSESTVWAEIT